MFYQKISLNVTFDFRDPYRPLKAVKQKNLIKSINHHTRTIIKKKICHSVCLFVCLSVCLFHYVEKNGAADMDNRRCKMQLRWSNLRMDGFGIFKTTFGFFMSKKHFSQQKGWEKFFCTKNIKNFFFSNFHKKHKKKNFRACFDFFSMFGSAALAGKVVAKSVLLKIF